MYYSYMLVLYEIKVILSYLICNYYSFSLTKATLNVRSTFEMNETD